VPARYTATRPYGGVTAEARAAARRDQLIDAAIELFGTDGYAATGVKQLCRAAGVTDRYFYESFRDRGELFSAAFDRVVGDLLAAVAEVAVAEAGSLERQARAAVTTFITALADEPARARLLFVEATAVGGDVGREVRASTRRFAELLAGAARSHLPTDVPPTRLSMAALSLVGAMGAVIIEWLDGDLEAGIDELIDYFVEMLLVASRAGLE
jgi:AcrR family transcriptional regulator